MAIRMNSRGRNTEFPLKNALNFSHGRAASAALVFSGWEEISVSFQERSSRLWDITVGFGWAFAVGHVL